MSLCIISMSQALSCPTSQICCTTWAFLTSRSLSPQNSARAKRRPNRLPLDPSGIFSLVSQIHATRKVKSYISGRISSLPELRGSSRRVRHANGTKPPLFSQRGAARPARSAMGFSNSSPHLDAQMTGVKQGQARSSGTGTKRWTHFGLHLVCPNELHP